MYASSCSTASLIMMIHRTNPAAWRSDSIAFQPMWRLFHVVFHWENGIETGCTTLWISLSPYAEYPSRWWNAKNISVWLSNYFSRISPLSYRFPCTQQAGSDKEIHCYSKMLTCRNFVLKYAILHHPFQGTCTNRTLRFFSGGDFGFSSWRIVL